MFAVTTLTNQFNFPQHYQYITFTIEFEKLGLIRFVLISDKWGKVEYSIEILYLFIKRIDDTTSWG